MAYPRLGPPHRFRPARRTIVFPAAPPAAGVITAAELKAAAALDSLVRKPAEALYGKDWHGTFGEPGEGTPTGWTVIEGEEYATARWWRYGFPAPAFAGLTFAESLGEGQSLAIVLGDNKLGNAVVLKLFWNNAEEYFYALYEQVGGEEVEPLLASGFVPRVKGDRFYLSFEEGAKGIRAWRQTGGGDPEAFAEGTLTKSLEVYGASADLILQGTGSFRGTEFTAVSLNPEPPIEEKPAGKTVVALQAQDWGGATAADIAGAVHTARFDTEDEVSFLEELLAAGLKISCLFAGPYDEGGVSALDPDEWVANALAYYEAHLTPTQAPVVEILNEPHGPWFWGEEAGNAANAVAYRTLIKKAYEGFHAEYGSEAPKIIASVEGLNGIEFGEKWWEPSVAAYLDGVVIHAYGGNDPEKKAASAEGHRDHVEEARLLTGESLPVYVTEVGWPTATKEEPTGDSLQWAEAEQAENLTNFFNWARATKYIAEVSYYCYHDFGEKTWYGIVNLAGTHKPSYATLQAQTAIYDSPEPEPPSRIAVTREFPSDKLAVRVADPATGQTVARWAEDEHKAENILSGISKVGEMSGGHKEMGGALARDPRADYPDLSLYNDIYLEQPGGENVWEGRLQKPPKSDGDHMAIEPKAAGHQVALEDRQALRIGFIDSDLSKWGDPSTQRRVNITGGSLRLNGNASTGWQGDGEHGPGVLISLQGVTSESEKTDAAESWFDGGRIPIGAALYHFIEILGGTGPQFTTQLKFGSDDLLTGHHDGPNHEGKTNSSTYEYVEAVLENMMFAVIEGRRLAKAGEEAQLVDQFLWEYPKIISRLAAENLSLQGTWPNVGFTAKQMLGLAVPENSYLEARDEDLEDDGFIIPQAWFSEDGNLATVIKELLKYGLLRWFVMREKRFEVRAPGTFGREWQAYAGPSELKETGEDGERVWDKLVVSFQDVSGRTLRVGYLGSGADVETPALEVTDPDNAAVKAGRPREALLTLNGISEAKLAQQAGERFLEEVNVISHAGEATLKGYIQDSTGVFRPVAQIQPGDRIRFPDAGSSGTGYREIVQVTYDHDSRTATVSLDAPPEALQALLERFNAILTPLALS